MKEIEVKAKLSNRTEVIEKLQALGCSLSETKVQKDRIFVPQGLSVPVEPGVNVLRVREQNGKYLLTLKQTITNELDCIEHELGIDNPTEMIEIFKLLGFVEDTQVNKTRQTAHYNDYEICLDSVENLGDFIEVEKLTDEADSAIIQQELFSFLETLGITKVDQVFHGYDVLMKHKELK